MRFLFIDTYYSEFLRNYLLLHSKIRDRSYALQLKDLLAQFFGTSDFYSFNIRKIGHQAADVIANCEPIQRRWAKEHRLEISQSSLLSWFQTLPFLHRFIGRPSWIQKITLAQISLFRPDVLYLQDLTILNPSTLKTAKTFCRLLVGQIASPLPPPKYLDLFDLVLTSFPHFVKKIKKMGTSSEYFKIAFEPRILKKIRPLDKIYDVTFIGSFTPQHSKGIRLLEAVAKQIPLQIWGKGIEYVGLSSPLRANFHGQAWGLDMYKILAQSKIVINRHIDVAGNNANNMRLYETTGMGALLITDSKQNLKDLFQVDKEVISYTDANDLIGKIKYYLSHEKEREKIARAGQNRTLTEHIYPKRINEMVEIIGKYL